MPNVAQNGESMNGLISQDVSDSMLRGTTRNNRP